MTWHVYAADVGWISAKRLRDALQERLGEKVWLIGNSQSNLVKQGDTVVVWGKSKEPSFRPLVKRFFNDPALIRANKDKLSQYEKFRQYQVLCPPYTGDVSMVTQWLSEGSIVLARQTDNTHDGEGITVVRQASKIPPAKFYTLYIKKYLEYRVTVFGGRVIDYQQKKRENGSNQTADQALIRTGPNGFVFCRNDIVRPQPETCENSVRAVKALSLDFGGVDIVEGHDGRSYVLEVNKAPEIFQIGASRYAEAFLNG